MPKYQIQRSIHINASPQTVFEKVADYGAWTSWSPWLCAEPEAKVEVSENANSVGSVYSWSGKIVGAGEIEHKSLVPGKRIDDEIRFLKPFKSVSQVAFDFVAENDPSEGEGTKVTWHMNGAMPWFLFWMVPQIKTFVGMDYERGLKMLKEWIETGHVNSSTKVHGEQDMGPFQVIGVRKTCTINEIGPSMNSAFSEAAQKLGEHNLANSGEKVSVYHRFDTKSQTFEYTSGFLFGKPVESVPSELSSWSMPHMSTLRVDHTGSYDHLGNAWSAANQHARYKKLKQSKIGAFELYKNDPQHTEPEHLHTEIYLPIK